MRKLILFKSFFSRIAKESYKVCVCNNKLVLDSEDSNTNIALNLAIKAIMIDLELTNIRTRRGKVLQNYNLEQAIKLCINSIYGAFANDYFHFRNTDIAETVTLQGQDAIKHTEKAVEKYFKEYWHKDKKLHESLGITCEVQPLTQHVWKYTDTDSGYIIFEEVMESCKWEGTVTDFI